MTKTEIDKKLKKTWQNMVHRCTNPTDKRFSYYSTKGVGEPWLYYSSFHRDMFYSFVAHVNQHGLENTTLDRINNDLGYSRENCRWATWELQRENRQPSKKVFRSCKWCGREFLVYKSQELISCREEQCNAKRREDSRQRKLASQRVYKLKRYYRIKDTPRFKEQLRQWNRSAYQKRKAQTASYMKTCNPRTPRISATQDFKS